MCDVGIELEPNPDRCYDCEDSGNEEDQLPAVQSLGFGVAKRVTSGGTENSGETVGTVLVEEEGSS